MRSEVFIAATIVNKGAFRRTAGPQRSAFPSVSECLSFVQSVHSALKISDVRVVRIALNVGQDRVGIQDLQCAPVLIMRVNREAVQMFNDMMDKQSTDQRGAKPARYCCINLREEAAAQLPEIS